MTNEKLESKIEEFKTAITFDAELTEVLAIGDDIHEIDETVSLNELRDEVQEQ